MQRFRDAGGAGQEATAGWDMVNSASMHGLIDPVKRYAGRIQRDDVAGLAAELAYRFLFAIFPFGIFVAALSAFVAGALGLGDPTATIIKGLGDNLPPNLAGGVRDQLEQVIGHARPDLLSFGAIAALWAATGGTNALIKAMNRAFELPESRGFLSKLLWAIGLTFLGGVGIIAAFVTIVGSSIVTQQLAARSGTAGTAGPFWDVVSLIRWPIAFAVLVIAAAIIYRYGPNVRTPWRWAFGGATVFAVFWLLLTLGFSIYVSLFGRFNATYGALAGVIVLMLWFYLTAFVVVAAAELVAMLVAERDPEVLRARRRETGVEEVAERAVDGMGRTFRRAEAGAAGAIERRREEGHPAEEDEAGASPSAG